MGVLLGAAKVRQMLTGPQFGRVQQLALRLTGIVLYDRHRESLCWRLRRREFMDQPQVETLLDQTEAGEMEAVRRFIGWITTRFTSFFRIPWHFDIAAEHTLWSVHQRGTARVWSAAAATGEEPYSLAMAVMEVFGRPDPPVAIVATDVDLDSLVIAQTGAYREPALRSITTARKGQFFVQNSSNATWTVSSAVRRLVEFRPLNLASATWPLAGPWDVIFCRNVMMYLEAQCRETVVARMALMLAPGGILIVDPSEHLGQGSSLFSSEGQGVFRLRKPVDGSASRVAAQLRSRS